MYDAIADPYTYEKSTVLINKLDLRNQADLDAFEAEISSARSDEPLPNGTLDFAHYCSIHFHLFQDVYEWAGQVRTVRLSKAGNPFCFPENIAIQAIKLFNQLKAEAFFANLSATAFAEKAAHFLAELNAIHVFREGNGRAQLTFISLVAEQAGHTLNMEKLDPKKMLAAMIASFDGDENQLTDIIMTLIG